MKTLIKYLSLLGFVLTLAACSARNTPPLEIQESYNFAPGEVLTIVFHSGTLNLSASEEEQVEIKAVLTSPESTEFEIDEHVDGVAISTTVSNRTLSRPRDEAVQLEIAVPAHAEVEVTSWAGEITVSDLAGSVSVHSTIGNIIAANLSGVAWLIAPRGDVTVYDSDGEIHLLGEHGVLRFENSSGELAATTIMGTLEYAGLLSGSDVVRLESDHGPVNIALANESSADISLATNTAHITCTMPGLSSSMTGCSDILGDGDGRLTVRTVTGAITITPWIKQ